MFTVKKLKTSICTSASEDAFRAGAVLVHPTLHGVTVELKGLMPTALTGGLQWEHIKGTPSKLSFTAFHSFC